jgi:hypothetical protein
MADETGSGLVIQLANGARLPLVTGPAGIKEIFGDPRSDHSIRSDCANGVIPTLPRAEGSGAHHRVPVARYLDKLGIPYEIVTVSAS